MTNEKQPQGSNLVLAESRLLSPVRRRLFLNYLGMTAAATTLLLAGCSDDDDTTTPPAAGNTNLANNDTGILNYAYALEQLEAAFYTKVISTGFFSANGAGDQTEKNLLKDIRDHEIAHRDFFRAALGNNRIVDLQVNFDAVNFNDRNSVLQTAMTFEDLGVSAYNGAGELLDSADFLLLAGKIVSVEARHAAYIRDLISNGTFSDSADANGLDPARMPSQVLALADPFIVTTLTTELP